MTTKATDIIPEEILHSTVKDFLNQKDAPFTYGEWQVVDFDNIMKPLPRTHYTDHDTVFSSSFIFRNVESDYYYRATLAYDTKRVILERGQEIIRVVRKMVPVYEAV